MNNREHLLAEYFVHLLQHPDEGSKNSVLQALRQAWFAPADIFEQASLKYAKTTLDPHVGNEHLSDYRIDSPKHKPSIFGQMKWTRYLPADIILQRIQSLPLEYSIACFVEHIGPAVYKHPQLDDPKSPIQRIWQYWNSIYDGKRSSPSNLLPEEGKILYDCLMAHKDLGTALDLPDLNAIQLTLLAQLDNNPNNIWNTARQFIEATELPYIDIDDIAKLQHQQSPIELHI